MHRRCIRQQLELFNFSIYKHFNLVCRRPYESEGPAIDTNFPTHNQAYMYQPVFELFEMFCCLMIKKNSVHKMLYIVHFLRKLILGFKVHTTSTQRLKM